MIKKIISMIVMILILSSTFAYAADVSSTNNDKKDSASNEDDRNIYVPGEDNPDKLEEIMGQDVVINIDQYQPRVIRTSLLEEQNINVYALLTGIPSNPTITIDKISNINVKPVKITTKPAGKKINIGSVKYIKPQRQSFGLEDYLYDAANGIVGRSYQDYNLKSTGYKPDLNYNNLGTIVIPIKRIPKENDVPDSIEIELEGKIDLMVSEDLGHSSYGFAMPQETEAEWSKHKEDYNFYAGYIRADSVKEDTATFDAYDVNGQRITRTPVKIKVGEKKVFAASYSYDTLGRLESAYNSARGYGSIFDKYYVTLDRIRSRTKSVNAVIYKEDGSTIITTLSEGSRLYPESSYIVDKIEQLNPKADDVKGKDVKRVTLRKEGESLASKALRKISSADDLTIEFGEDVGNEKPKTSAANGNGKENAANCKEKIKSLNKKITELLKKTENGAIDSTNLKNQVNEISKQDSQCSAENKEEAENSLRELGSYYVIKFNEYTADEKNNLANKYGNARDEIIKIIESLTGSSEAGITSDIKTGSESQYLRNAIAAYQEVVDKYSEQPEAAKAQLRIGYIYIKLNDEANAIKAFKEFIDAFGDQGQITAAEINILIKELEKGIKIKSKAKRLEDNGGFITIYLTGVKLPAAKDQSSAYISVNNGPSRLVREGSLVDESNLPGYVINSIDYSEVILSSPENDKTEINVRSSRAISNKNINVRVDSINLQREAVVTIEPVSEKGESFVRFKLHLPIEKRPFELPLFSDTIDKEINKTQKLIDKLSGIIDNVDKLYNYWVKGCYATFAVVWAKNLLSGKVSNVARDKIRDKWEEQYKNDKAKESFDSYIMESKNYKKYNEDLKVAEGIIKEIDSMKFSDDNTISEDYKKLLDEKSKAPDSLKDWYFAREFSKYDPSYLSKFIEEDFNLKKEVADKKIYNLFKNLHKEYKQNSLAAYGYAGLSKEDFIGNEAELIGIIRDLELKNQVGISLYGTKFKQYDSSAILDIDNWLNANQEIKTKIDSLEETKKAKVKDILLKNLKAIKDTQFREYESPNSISINQINIISNNGEYYYIDRSTRRQEQLYTNNDKTNPTTFSGNNRANDLNDYIGKNKKLYIRKTDPNDSSKIYFLEVSVTRQEQKEKHKPTVTRFAESNRNQGLVEQISIDANHYVELEYSSNGRIANENIYLRPIPNSQVGSSSDIRLGTLQDEINSAKSDGNKADYLASLKGVNDCITKLNYQFGKKTNYRKGDKINCKSGLGSYTIDEAPKEPVGPNCVDFMNPGDCKLLFNACDPVICPASRCNLGGNWKVDNVVQTGLIGSSVLCLPNFPQVMMPVCITGINAGLQNINSILKGYKQCLITQQVKGQSVGICDRIRNIYVCDMLWREGLAIFNFKGGLMSLITEKIAAAADGSEYSSFRDNIDNSVDSLKYFTQNYAKNVFASYNGGSLDEIGTEICKAAIFGKVPGVGNIFNEIQKPESPPQFIAFFDQVPYQEISSVQTSLYSIYYHIYAGENEDISYSVYLKGIDEAGGLLIRPQFIAQNKLLAKGQFADENIDREYPKGYNEICVDIQTTRYGRISECGFGKVTTDFGMNYLNDMYLAGEAKKKINSEKECVSEAGRLTDFSYSDGSIAGGSLSSNIGKAAVGSFSTGLTQTGIVRKCAGEDPDLANPEKDNWKPVGSCGKDDKGRDLGVCYLYSPALSNLIKDKERLAETQKTIESVKSDMQKEGGYNLGLLSEADVAEFISNAKFAKLRCVDKSTVDKCENAIKIYQKIVAKADNMQSKAEAQFGIGEVYEAWYKALIKPEIVTEKKAEMDETESAAPTSPVVNLDKKLIKIQEKEPTTEPASAQAILNTQIITSAKLFFSDDNNKLIQNNAIFIADKSIKINAEIKESCDRFKNMFKFIYYIRTSKDSAYIFEQGQEFHVFGKNNENKCNIKQVYDISFDQFVSFEVYGKDTTNTNKKNNDVWIRIGYKSEEMQFLIKSKSIFKKAYLENNNNNLKPYDTVKLVAEFEKNVCDKNDKFSLRLREDDYIMDDDKTAEFDNLNPNNDCKLLKYYTLKEDDFDVIGKSQFYVDVYDSKSELIGSSIEYVSSKD